LSGWRASDSLPRLRSWRRLPEERPSSKQKRETRQGRQSNSTQRPLQPARTLRKFLNMNRVNRISPSPHAGEKRRGRLARNHRGEAA
jgi:hypothetical protein